MKLSPVHADAISGSLYFMGKISQHRIVFQQMRQRFRVGDIVNRHELDIFIAQSAPEDIPANSTETIDAYSHCHLNEASSYRCVDDHTRQPRQLSCMDITEGG